MGLALVLEAALLAAAEPEQYNVVLILADDLGWRDLGSTGSTFYETPAIDRLASQGMRFTQAYAACNVCSPTRASILTGLYPARVRITNFIGGNRRGALLPAEYLKSLPPEVPTLAELLRREGYRTAIFGKWHLGDKESPPQNRGFDVADIQSRPGGGPPDDPHFAAKNSIQAARFIEESKERRFFLYLPLHSVHVPLKTRPDLLKKYKDKAAGLPKNEGPRDVPVDRAFKARAVQDHPVYAGMVQEMDEAAARVLGKLDELELSDRTIVVFFSDNGGLSTAEGSPTSNLPLKAGKGWNYEGGLREPLLFRLPGRIAAGSTSDVPVISNDLFPTLLELAGTKPAEKTDGVSLVPVLEGKETIPERPLFWHYPHYSNQGGRPGGAVRLGNWKLLESYENRRIELYDLSRDPGEERDLAASEPLRAKELAKMLAGWRESVGAQMPSPNPDPVEPFGPKAVPKK